MLVRRCTIYAGERLMTAADRYSLRSPTKEIAEARRPTGTSKLDVHAPLVELLPMVASDGSR